MDLRCRFIMKEQYPVEFNEMAKNFLDNILNEFDMAYPTALMSDREVRRSTALAWTDRSDLDEC